MFKMVLFNRGLNESEMREYITLLNDVRIGTGFSEIERNQAAFLCSEIENKYYLYSNEDQAKEPARILRFSQANREAAEKLDPENLLTESDITIDKHKVLGSGAFGTVYAGTKNGLPVAVKVLNKDVSEKDRRAFLNEAKILAHIHHPYCCEYEGYMKDPFRIVTRRYPTDLYHYSSGGTLDLNNRFRIAYQLTSAICYIHSVGLLHRDLKSENIFIDDGGNVRVADFGLTMYAPDRVRDDGSPPGTLLFMAPEQLLDVGFDQKAEVYTLGVMLWELFTGRLAFDDVNTEDELKERQKAVPMLPILEKDYTGEGKPPQAIFDLIEKCYSYKPEDRPDLVTVLKGILDIGVHHVVNRSSTAEKFWKMVCSYNYRYNVLLPEFIDNMKLKPKPKFSVAETLQAVRPSWKLMDIQHYWYMCCWFPHFFRSTNALSTMHKIVHADWYCPDEQQVECRLKAATGQAFVIRPSTTNPFDDPFTLCVRNTDGSETFYHITRKVVSGSTSFVCDLTDDKEFASLSIFAKYIKGDVKIPIAPKATDLRAVYGNR